MKRRQEAPPPTVVREACSCGAEVEIQAADGQTALRHVKGWRAGHRHELAEEKKRTVGFTSDHEAA